MTKAYSNKALPAGTVLREWRLEDVLGVGGFGIVYKGRGIYFNELVAIKEYFPSSISERNAEATVVPVDSDAEEVHALGLKKFVEEAKLLWNLSTPTRHPNIVNVRSLFEIHGTAYMVMDFEDGVSLSKLIRQGQKFNERSLRDLIHPIAEGLDRAHRVGVLHRDIKPPNILINEDGRPVLIDFGSARFEAAEATSTKVTFHTPPYAAIEQYVKTYKQGPWTDIYALGVVLYECVTGEKPPEVLERMHGGAGTPLAEGKWPGYSKKFLAAIDAAMTIRPDDRPQSIAAWLALFNGGSKRPKNIVVGGDEEATRLIPFDKMAEPIAPVAPPAADFAAGDSIETGVPADPSEAEFKRAGQDTGISKKIGARAASAKASKERDADEPDKVGAAKPAPEKKPEAESPKKEPKRSLSPVLAGTAAVMLLAITASWALSGRSDEQASAASDTSQNLAGDQSATADVEGLGNAAQLLADDARAAGAPEEVVNGLTQVGEELNGRFQAYRAIAANPAHAAMAAGAAEEMRRLASSANVRFAEALMRDADARVARVSANAPWADPARPDAAARESAERREAAASLRSALTGLRSQAAEAATSSDPALTLAAARQALTQWQTFGAASSAVNALQAAARVAEAPLPPPTQGAAPVAAPTRSRQATAVSRPAQVAPSAGVSAAKRSQFESLVDDGRDMARRVIRMGDRNRAGRNASDEERKNYELRRNNARLARNYDSYLVNLKDSMRGITSDREADRLISQARQTNAYLTFLVRSSSGAR